MEKTSEIRLVANVNELPKVLAMIDSHLEEADCPIKTMMQIDIAVEEIFVNVAHYAYAPEEGDVTVRVSVCDDPGTVSITFIDEGVPYDPLRKEDPDVTLPVEKREIGGLGIFMTRKFMDDMQYEHKDGCNCLTLIRHW